MVGQYLKLVSANAWKIMWKRFAPTRENAGLNIFLFVVGVVVLQAVKGWDFALEDALVSVLTGFAAIVAAMAVAYVGYWLSAPFRLWRKDQQKLVAIVDQTKHKQVAKELQSCIEDGQFVLSQYRTLAGRPNVPAWRESAEAIVAKCGDEELAMFKTLFPAEPGPSAAYGHGPSEQDILKGLIEKLRQIMARQFQLAKRKGETSV